MTVKGRPVNGRVDPFFTISRRSAAILCRGAVFEMACSLWGGMRQGELFGLKWSDLDLEGRRYKVQRSLDSLYGPAKEKEPKRWSSRRSGVLLPEVVTVLQAHRQRQRHDKLRSGPRWSENDYVFHHDQGDATEGRQRAQEVPKAVVRGGRAPAPHLYRSTPLVRHDARAPRGAS
jgi:integrase